MTTWMITAFSWLYMNFFFNSKNPNFYNLPSYQLFVTSTPAKFFPMSIGQNLTECRICVNVLLLLMLECLFTYKHMCHHISANFLHWSHVLFTAQLDLFTYYTLFSFFSFLLILWRFFTMHCVHIQSSQTNHHSLLTQIFVLPYE